MLLLLLVLQLVPILLQTMLVNDINTNYTAEKRESERMEEMGA